MNCWILLFYVAHMGAGVQRGVFTGRLSRVWHGQGFPMISMA